MMVHQKYGVFIVINSNESPWRQNYDLAHELFQLYTWELYSYEEFQDIKLSRDIEKKADRFASTLLLPSEKNNYYTQRHNECIVFSRMKTSPQRLERITWKTISFKIIYVI